MKQGKREEDGAGWGKGRDGKGEIKSWGKEKGYNLRKSRGGGGGIRECFMWKGRVEKA